MQAMTDATPPWTTLAITGASSGLGRALAIACARPGATLHLAARNAARLAEIAAACRARGAEVRDAVLDVRDAAGCAAWVAGMARLDLLIANAGISGGTGGVSEPAAQVRAIFDTNVSGVLNTALPALDRMAAQAPGADGVRGRVAVIASVAAFVAAPGAAAYCASKAAVQRWAEATDATERARGLRVHAVCPGYIRTPMTAVNRFPMPFMLEPEEAACRTLAGLRAGRTRIAYPWPTYAMARIAGAVPLGLRAAVAARMPAKPVAEA
ncbi:SDR family NAD(P)-dependent oxidoreductase [Roseomonas vastitatis]|uniref:SDR family NAD(P)-dependent oxidoreductase n=2 Tax=Teichococcus vastitatis TaxID=2307076 RepID=A0ABS9W0J9_9PROT|nr:SDR family NAD(P)-dependent oxidoreductase [Pseudoroseomonas vastitatis]MCI0752425.1 SDR family NAD(P)-dependent oxidoreductase [Pseudoroseomonas vastitatis]